MHQNIETKEMSTELHELSNRITKMEVHTDELSKSIGHLSKEIKELSVELAKSKKTNWPVIATFISVFLVALSMISYAVFTPLRDGINENGIAIKKNQEAIIKHIQDGHPNRLDALVSVNTHDIEDNKRMIEKITDYIVNDKKINE